MQPPEGHHESTQSENLRLEHSWTQTLSKVRQFSFQASFQVKLEAVDREALRVREELVTSSVPNLLLPVQSVWI